MRQWKVCALVALLAAGPAAAGVAPQPAELTISGPAVVLVGAAATFEGVHRTRYGALDLPATRIELFVDGSPEGTDVAYLGDWSIDHTFPARGDVAVHAVAEDGLPHASTSRTVLVRVAEPPTAPEGLVATAVQGIRAVDLSWAPPLDDGGAPIVSYRVERRDDGGAWVTLATLGATARAHRDVDLAMGRSYEYALVASNAVAGSSQAVVAPSGAPPASPSLSATPRDASAIVDLAAAAGAGITQRIAIERSLDAGATWSLVAAGDGTTRAATDTVSFSGPRPLYRAIAQSVLGSSAPAAASVVGSPPGEPTAVLAEMTSVVKVRWSAPATGGPVQQYRVLDRGAQVALLAPNAREATVAFAQGGPNAWTVQALSLAGEGPVSDAVSVSVPSPPSFTATPRSASSVVDLFAAETGGVTQTMEIQKSVNGGASWTTIQSAAVTSLAHADAIDFAAPLPSYRALARNIVGASAPTIATVVGEAPGAPQNARADVTDVIRLRWDAPTTGGVVQQYRVLDRGAPIALLSASSLSLVVTATPGVSHAWSVQALNVAGASAPSGIVTVSPPAAPALTLSVLSGTDKVRLAASATDPLARTLDIERSLNGGASWTLVASGAAPSLTTDVSVDLGASPRAIFRALARGPTGASTATPADILGSAPSVPTNLRFTTGYDIKLEWNAASGAQAYEVRDGNALLARAVAPATSLVLAPLQGVPLSLTVEAVSYVGASGRSGTLVGVFEQPSAPTSLSHSVRERFNGAYVDLSWSGAGSNGGASILRYEVWRTPGPAGGTERVANLSASARSYVGDAVAGDGTSYSYAVRAVNAMGSGPSATVTAAPDLGWDLSINAVSFEACERIYPTVGAPFWRCETLAPGGTFQRTDDSEPYAHVRVSFTGTLTRDGAPVGGVVVTTTATTPGDTDCEVCSIESRTTDASGRYQTGNLGSWPVLSANGCRTFTGWGQAQTSAWRSNDAYPSVTVCAA